MLLQPSWTQLNIHRKYIKVYSDCTIFLSGYNVLMHQCMSNTCMQFVPFYVLFFVYKIWKYFIQMALVLRLQHFLCVLKIHLIINFLLSLNFKSHLQLGGINGNYMELYSKIGKVIYLLIEKILLFMLKYV